ncbi:Transposable element Tc3 transposase, partial [Araneus ventricosus]
MTRSTSHLAPLSPNFRATPVGGSLTHDVRFYYHQPHIHVGSSVESGFEAETFKIRSLALTTRPPRPHFNVVRRPDRNIKYWHDLRKDPSSFFSRQIGGGSVMVWAAFGFNGKVALAFLDGRQNSPKYIEILENHLMPFAENIGGGNWEYQHDNAPIHTSSATNNYLNSKNVTVLEWPPMSPELNPIENVWCIMSRKVYENVGQFYAVNALKAAIESA